MTKAQFKSNLRGVGDKGADLPSSLLDSLCALARPPSPQPRAATLPAHSPSSAASFAQVRRHRQERDQAQGRREDGGCLGGDRPRPRRGPPPPPSRQVPQPAHGRLDGGAPPAPLAPQCKPPREFARIGRWLFSSLRVLREGRYGRRGRGCTVAIANQTAAELASPRRELSVACHAPGATNRREAPFARHGRDGCIRILLAEHLTLRRGPLIRRELAVCVAHLATGAHSTPLFIREAPESWQVAQAAERPAQSNERPFQ